MNKLELINLGKILNNILEQVNALAGNKLPSKFKYVQSDLIEVIKIVEKRVENSRE